MSRRVTGFFELMLIMVVIISLGLGVNWYGGSALATQVIAQATPTSVAQDSRITGQNDTRPPVLDVATATAVPVGNPESTPQVVDSSLPAMTGTIGPMPTSAVIGTDYKSAPAC